MPASQQIGNQLTLEQRYKMITMFKILKQCTILTSFMAITMIHGASLEDSLLLKLAELDKIGENVIV